MRAPTTPWRRRSRRWREHSPLERLWRLARTSKPVTFTEKVRYKMLRDRRRLIVTFADKAAVRGYVAATVGAHYLPGACGVLDDPRELEALELPEAYVVKPTHGSGAVIVVSPAAPPEARLPEAEWGWVYSHVRPEHVDRKRLDLYHLPDRVIFGELTNYPAGGDSPFEPEDSNTVFGEPWRVPRRYR
ncbi:ATP-grasp fold amidoligase family protein [Pseudoclavibacter helvolus]|uniref:ATP-grasp fold amidoligase family protein n=1 Tax=Pseudoclavibacter helvolus TaxID=255205 RepID=UPI003C7366FC